MTRRRLTALAVCAVAVLSIFARGQVSTSDGLEMYRVSVSIVDDRDVWLDEVPRIGVAGRDGHRTSKYGPLLPIVGVVPVALVTPVAKVVGHEDQLRQAAWSLLIPAAAVVLLLWMVALGVRLGASWRWAVAAAAGALLCTYALPYTEDSFTEPLTALAVVSAVERFLAGRLGTAGALIGLGMLARPQLAPVAGLLVAAAAWDAGGPLAARARQALPAVAGPTLAVAALAAYNLLRFGEATQTGYRPPGDPGFTTPILDGLYGLLLTSSKSVLLFAPLVLLVPWGVRAVWRLAGDTERAEPSGTAASEGWGSAQCRRGPAMAPGRRLPRCLGGTATQRRRRLALGLLIGNAAVTLVTTATWWSWMGGWSWGPRLLLPGLLPLLVVLGPWLTTTTRAGTGASRHTTAPVEAICAPGRRGTRWPLPAFAALCLTGLAVSAPTLLVSPQAQLLDRPVPEPGPSITRQYALVPSRISALRDPADPVTGADQKKLVPVWQVALAREAGTRAYAVGVPLTGALLLLLGWGARGLRRESSRASAGGPTATLG